MLKEMQNLRRMVQHIVNKGNQYLELLGGIQLSRRIEITVASIRGAIDFVHAYDAQLYEKEAAVRSELETPSDRVSTMIDSAWELSRRIRAAMEQILEIPHDVHQVLPEIEGMLVSTEASSSSKEVQDK